MQGEIKICNFGWVFGTWTKQYILWLQFNKYTDLQEDKKSSIDYKKLPFDQRQRVLSNMFSTQCNFLDFLSAQTEYSNKVECSLWDY